MWIKNVNTTCSMPQQSAYFQTFKQLHGNKYNWAILISIRQVHSFIGILSVLEDSKKISDNCGICAKGCAVNERTRRFKGLFQQNDACPWNVCGQFQELPQFSTFSQKIQVFEQNVHKQHNTRAGHPDWKNAQKNVERLYTQKRRWEIQLLRRSGQSLPQPVPKSIPVTLVTVWDMWHLKNCVRSTVSTIWNTQRRCFGIHSLGSTRDTTRQVTEVRSNAGACTDGRSTSLQADKAFRRAY